MTNNANESGTANKKRRVTPGRALAAAVATGALLVGVNMLRDSGDQTPVSTTTTTETPGNTTTVPTTDEATISPEQDSLVLTQPTPSSTEPNKG